MQSNTIECNQIFTFFLYMIGIQLNSTIEYQSFNWRSIEFDWFNNRIFRLITPGKDNACQSKVWLRTWTLQFKHPGLFTCKDCIHHKKGYILPTNSFSFKLRNGKIITWNYQKNFTCDSKNVLYILKCNGCDNFYLGQTKDLKQRII